MAFSSSSSDEARVQAQLDRVPPHNLEAEQAVLGSLLIDKEAMIRVADVVTPEDFYRETHAMILRAMLELYERREPIDVLSLSNRLEERAQLDAIGGRTYLMTLANAVPTASNIFSYATIVQRKATLRRLLHSASEMMEKAYHEEEDIDVVLDQAEQSLFQVTQKYLKQNFIPLTSALTEAFERIDEIHKEGGKLRGIPTGFVDLDKKLGGLQKSDLIILASRPSMGKTSFALDIARNIAVQSKTPVGIFSLEMSKDQLVDRLLSSESKVDMWKMRTGELSDHGPYNDFERIGHALGVLSEAPIFIDDSATSNIMEIRTKARRLQSEFGLGLLVIDYLQLMEGRTKTENRVQEVSEISRSLKALARELNIPIIALSQLSRAVEMNHPPIPKLSHLRESGSIEQDADVVMFIYREGYYKKDSMRPNEADIIIAKHRNGPTGEISLIFQSEYVSFQNLAQEYVGAPPPVMQEEYIGEPPAPTLPQS
ncbi:MAG: replicative DNA helicase [Candidatus Kerfeldbacteria bacterium]|nr:replicative DNA helicase [Candidatus Kerfeldbacteria bacterium]